MAHLKRDSSERGDLADERGSEGVGRIALVRVELDDRALGERNEMRKVRSGRRQDEEHQQ